jgi:tetratricopeptide (TPR) repeat protein
MNLTLSRSLLAAPLLAFAAALALWLALDDTPSLPSASPSAAPRLTGTSADIPALQAAVRAAPDAPALRVELAAAYLQRVRETGDPGFYARAEGVLEPALAAHPRDADVLTEAGLLALARHDFRGALALGRRARAAQPELIDVSAVLVDASVELGRYGEAEAELQRMVDRKPNLAAYARISYLRELHGDLAGAASAMRLAVSAGGPALENRAYVTALLGELERQRGDERAARRAFAAAVAAVPGHPGGTLGLARLDAAAGDLGGAIARLRPVAERLPLPEYVIALGEAELAAGRGADGRRDLGLVGAEEKLLRAAGVDTDAELAVYEADHGDPKRALALARRAWADAPSGRSADALGWALTRSGDAAAGYAWARRALRLGSMDPVWRAHAGLAALAAGKRADGRRELKLALAHGLDGWPWQARRAREALR